jgi:hypothetical protein
MTLGLALLLALIPGIGATTLTVPNTFVFREVVALHTKLNANFAAVATWANGGVCSDNIGDNCIGATEIGPDSVALTTDTTGDYVSGVTASQGLLKTGTEGATLGLIDGAANEVMMRNSGDTAWTTGLVALANLSGVVQALITANITLGRASFVAETSTLSELTYVGDVRSPFSGTSLSDGAMVSMTYCLSGSVGTLFLIENNTATDRVHRIVASTMLSASPATTDLAVGDNPVDLVCAPDGSVYILNNGTIFKTIKKIDSAGVITTFYDLTTARNVDNVVRIFIDPNGVSILVIGQDTTITQDRMLFKMTVADPNIGGTLTTDADADTTDRDGFFLKKDGVSKFLVLQEELAGSDNCCLRPVDISVSPPTADIGLDCNGANDIEIQATGTTLLNCRSVLFDGQVIIVSGKVDVAVGPTEATTFLLDSKIIQGTALQNPLWVENSTEIDGDPRFGVFTGKFVAWQRSNSNSSSAGQVNILEPPFYSAGMAMTNLNYRAALGGTNVPAGISTDGTFLYVATKRSDTNAMFTVTKNLMN